jgi:outer membrane cobalamin receptor
VGATSRFIISPKLWAALSAAVREETGNAAGFLAGTIPSAYRIIRTSMQANAEAQYSTGSFTATAGLSLQKTNDYGEVTSPRLRLSWRVNQSGLRLKTSWAKGFKLPSFYSLADPNVGNPALRPERSRAFDGGFEQAFGKTGISISAAYFRNDYRDLVDFSSTLFRLVNRSQALTQGIEFGAQYSATRKVHFGLEFSYTAWKLQDTSDPLRNIPHANGGIHADWQISRRLRARAETQFMSRRYDYELPAPEETTVGGYSNTNLSADYALSERVTAYLRADNVLNSKYHEYIGFPNPGISMRLGVVYHIRKPDKIP